MTKIYDRDLYEANLMIKTKKTVREISLFSKVSKSTVHNDLTKKLKKINNHLYCKIQKILQFHKEIRHIKGGLATKYKYEVLKKNNRE